MSLKDDLTEIKGVGPATAEEILAVLDDHATDDAELARVQALCERGRAGIAADRLADMRS